jgi:hypothetical protein
MQSRFSIPAAAALAVALGATAAAQSLGDVAKKEEQRRKAVPKAGKVYTNDDLGAAPAAAPQPPPAAAAPAPGPQAKPEEKADDPKKDEAHWRARVAQTRLNLDRAKTFHDALQTRINSLSSDFAARDDPAQRSVVAADRQKALAELERVRKEIADLEKELRDIEDEARRAGVPPGWLR